MREASEAGAETPSVHVNAATSFNYRSERQFINCFFRAATVPTGVYASEGDFDGYQLRSEAVIARIEAAADEAAALLDVARLQAMRTEPALAAA